MSTTLQDKARGRWRDILAAAGLPAGALSRKNGPCPMCGGKDRFRFTDYQANGMWVCTHCGTGDGAALLMAYHGLTFAAAARMVEHHLGMLPPPPKRTRGPSVAALRADMRAVWAAGHPPQALGTVDMYLLLRGIVIDRYPTCIRETPRLRHHTGTYHPGMLALVRGADGTAVNVHRTYLADNGEKATVSPVRMYMRGGMPRGAAVRLAPHGDVLGIAEGIETALSASALFGVPVWAALDAGHLEWWQPPRGVRRVFIFGDNDTSGTGQLATDKLAWRLEAAGIAFERHLPDKAGMDWNDVLRARP